MATTQARFEITAIDNTALAFSRIEGHLARVKSAISGFSGLVLGGTAAFGLAELTRKVYDSTVQWQSWQYTLEAGGLTAHQTAQELKFLEDATSRLGIPLKDAGQAFSRLILTGRASGMSLEELNKDFEAISGAMRIFHLSGQQATRSWLALTEVMSIGHLQSRQFTQQLGRDWPGIGALIAHAMYGGADALERFQKDMESGKISSRDFMHAFQRLMDTPAMRGALAGAEDSIQAATGRLQTAFFKLFNEADNPALSSVTATINDLTRTLNDPKVKTGFDNLVGGMATAMKWAVDLAAKISVVAEEIGTGLAVRSMGKFGLDATNPLFDAQNKLAAFQQNVQAIKLQLQEAQGEVTSGGLIGRLIYGGQISELKSKLAEAEQEVAKWQNIVKGLQLGAPAPAASGPVLPATKVALPLTIEIEQATIASKKLEKTLTHAVDSIARKQQLKPLIEHLKEAKQQFSQFGIEAARNIQDAFAMFLFRPSQDGFRGMLRSFISVVQRMIAEAASAKILDALFGGGKPGAGQTGISNFFSSFFSSIFASQGTPPGRASGGPVSAGNEYLVAENGPELFRPSQNGTIFPLDALGGHHFQFHTTIHAGSYLNPATMLAALDARDQQLKADILYYLRRGYMPA